MPTAADGFRITKAFCRFPESRHCNVFKFQNFSTCSSKSLYPPPAAVNLLPQKYSRQTSQEATPPLHEQLVVGFFNSLPSIPVAGLSQNKILQNIKSLNFKLEGLSKSLSVMETRSGPPPCLLHDGFHVHSGHWTAAQSSSPIAGLQRRQT